MSTSIEGLSLVTVIALIRKEIADSRGVTLPGKDGAQGVKGDRGAKGDSGPAGRQGPKGNDGKQGKPGKDGSDGSDGACGEDGVGIEDITQDGDGAIIVTMTDGEVYTLDMPLPGETQVHYKVGGGSSGGDSGSVDLTGYVQRPTADKRDGSWLVYRENGTTKEWTPVTTDLVATNPDVLFRDAKGRFKSTEEVPELTNQLEVNRWLLEQIESVESGEIDLPPMTNDWTPNTLALRDNNGNAKFTQVTVKNITFAQNSVANNMADTWFLSGGEQSANGIKKNDAPGMRSSLDVYSKDEVDALGVAGEDGAPGKDGANGTDGKDGANGKDGADGDSFFTDLGNSTIQYFGNELQVTLMDNPFHVGAKVGNDISCSGRFISGTECFVGGSIGIKLDSNANSIVPVDEMGRPKVGIDLGSTAAKFKDGDFTGEVRATAFVGDGSQLTGTVSAKVLAQAFGDIQAALSNEKTVAGLKKALTNSLGGLIETLEREQ